MPPWLTETFVSDEHLPLQTLALRLSTALALGCVVAGVYRATRLRRDAREPRAGTPELTATLVLLTILIAMVTMVIGNNVARAFSLVGALAIVRFRTVVEDTRDTAFVIFAVAVGMAVGSGFLMAPLVGIPIAALAAWLFRPGAGEGAASGASVHRVITIRTGLGSPAEALLRETLARRAASPMLTDIATARAGAAIDHVYAVRLRSEDDMPALLAELSAIEGVQSVEMRRG